MKGNIGESGTAESALLGTWDFAAEISSNRVQPFDSVTDTSPQHLHEKLVNVPTRAVTGHNWTGSHHEFTCRLSLAFGPDCLD